MNIQVIKNGIVSGAATAFRALKSATIWGGHKIQAGFSDYLVPTIKSLWAVALVGLTKIAQFLKTGPGMAFSAAAGLFLTGNYLLKLTQENEYDDRPATRTALTALGITSVIAATLATAVGVSAVAVI